MSQVIFKPIERGSNKIVLTNKGVVEHQFVATYNFHNFIFKSNRYRDDLILKVLLNCLLDENDSISINRNFCTIHSKNLLEVIE